MLLLQIAEQKQLSYGEHPLDDLVGVLYSISAFSAP